LNPLLGYIFLVILFAFIGIPPLGLFFFKYLMFLAVTIVKMFSVLLILLFSTVLSVVYYIRMARNIVFTFREGLGEYISLRFFYVYFIIVGVYLVFFFVLFEYRVLLGLELFFADFWLLLPIVETELDLYVDKIAMLDVMIEKLEKLQDQALFSSRDVLEFKGLFDELFGEAEILR
jgi:formate hydrogenlyase subunit 3/multisubunit Na+/H+ antiporter MnhD subunit